MIHRINLKYYQVGAGASKLKERVNGEFFITFVKKKICEKIFYNKSDLSEKKVEKLLVHYTDLFHEELGKGNRVVAPGFIFFVSFDTITGKLGRYEIETPVMPEKKFFIQCICKLTRDREVFFEPEIRLLKYLKHKLDTTDLAYKVVNYERVR